MVPQVALQGAVRGVQMGLATETFRGRMWRLRGNRSDPHRLTLDKDIHL
jgi:hypothetical protein